jgi:hypothetical protein
MSQPGHPYDDKCLMALAGRFPQFQTARMAWFQEPAVEGGNPPTPVLLAEFLGDKADDVRLLRADVSRALVELGAPAEVEIVRSGWLPLGGDGRVVPEEISGRHAAAVNAKKRSLI